MQIFPSLLRPPADRKQAELDDLTNSDNPTEIVKYIRAARAGLMTECKMLV